MSISEPTTPLVPREDILRGALFALIILPVGVAAWVLVWSLGFIASIVAFGVALGAVWLYRLGARGPISVVGALVVTAITIGTLLIAFFAGIVEDALIFVAEDSGYSWAELIVMPEFWTFLGDVLPSTFGDYVPNLLMALLFGALGCFTVLRAVFREARAASTSEFAASPDAVAAAEGLPPVPQAPTADLASEAPAAEDGGPADER